MHLFVDLRESISIWSVREDYYFLAKMMKWRKSKEELFLCITAFT